MGALFVLLFLFSPLRTLPEVGLERGIVLDPVFCLHDLSQSYALYLPAAYHPEKSWPVIYCFDPGGQGAIPVGLFRAGAEKYGFILVGSNNSRNGPWETILEAARAVWRDTRARLAIDDRRITAAGFSGGARAACGLGKFLGVKLSGVIACGAGLPAWLSAEDMAGIPWFGTVGLRDFNFQEMQELERQLRHLGTPCLLRVFQGKHAWPPPKLAFDAVAWISGQMPKAESHDITGVPPG